MAMTLNALINHTIETNSNDDPQAIALKVAQATPHEVLIDYYTHAVVSTVRSVFRSRRNTALDEIFNPDNLLDNGPDDDEPADNGDRSWDSPKLKERRTKWARLLAVQVHTQNGWVHLGKCGRTELDFVITARNTLIGNIAAEVDRYKTFRDLLDEHSVDLVENLPENSVTLD